MALSGLFNRRAGSPAGTIDHDSMVAAVAANSHLLVDVREAAEFRAGTIPGAINIPLSAFGPQEVPDGRPVIVFCATGGRSGIAQQILASAGRRDVANYRPGVAGWRLQGGALA